MPESYPFQPVVWSAAPLPPTGSDPCCGASHPVGASHARDFVQGCTWIVEGRMPESYPFQPIVWSAARLPPTVPAFRPIKLTLSLVS